MKRIATFLLLLLFLFNIAGYYGVFVFQKNQVKNEIKRKIKNSIPESELIVLSFHPLSKKYSELEWIESHEFRYKGQMFDIVRQATDKDGTIHFYCINDKQEETLFANLDEHVQKNNSTGSNSAAKNILKLFSLLCIPCYEPLLPRSHIVQSFNYYCPHNYFSPILEIIAPPPRPV